MRNGLRRNGIRRLGRQLKRIPFSLAFLIAFLATGAATGSYLAGPPDALLEAASVSAPGLQGGLWWTMFSSLFFATNPLAYLAASVMVLGLMGLAEGSADIVLDDHGEDTLLVFAAQGGASGQVMRLGKAIIGHSAQKVIDGFFERFGTAMGAKVTPLPLPADEDATP